MTNFEWQLENWQRWCRKRDWMPLGHVSQLAALIKRAKRESLSASDVATPIFEEQAMGFNGLLMRLPKRLLVVFLLNHLDKGVLGQIIVYTSRTNMKYQLAGMSRTTYYERAKEADNMIRRWLDDATR